MSKKHIMQTISRYVSPLELLSSFQPYYKAQNQSYRPKILPYSRSHKRTSDYKRTPLFRPCLTSKFSVTLWENTFDYKHTPKNPQTRIYKHYAYERENTVVWNGTCFWCLCCSDGFKCLLGRKKKSWNASNGMCKHGGRVPWEGGKTAARWIPFQSHLLRAPRDLLVRPMWYS